MLNLREFESVTVIGPNGAGKSTLTIDALTWCIYGRTSLTDFKGYRQEDLVKTGSRECYVEVEFELGGDNYKVKRTYNITRRATFLDVSINNKRVDLKIKDAERFLNERIGLDYDGFINSTIIRQEEMKRLISEDPSRRKDIFISLFRLGIYEEALQKAKTNRTEAEIKLAGIKESLKAKEAFLGQEKNWQEKIKELTPLIQEVEEKEGETRKKLNILEGTVSELGASVEKSLIAEAKLKDKKERFENTELKLRNNRSLQSECEKQLRKYAEDVNLAEQSRRAYESMTSLKDEYNALTSEKKMLEQLVKVRVDQENDEIEKLQREHGLLLDEKQSLAERNDQPSDESSISTLRTKHEKSIDVLQQTARNFGRAEKNLEFEKTANRDKTRLTALKDTLNRERQKLSSSRKTVDETLDHLVSEIPRLSVFETKLNNIIERIKDVSSTLSERQSVLKEESLIIGEIDGIGQVSLGDANRILKESDAKISRLISAGYDPTKYDELRKKADEAIKAREELVRIKQGASGIESDIKSLTEEHDTLFKECKELSGEIESTKSIRENYQNARTELSVTQKQYAEVKEQLGGFKSKREEIQENLQNIKSYKSDIRDLINQQKEVECEISDYRKLESVFHRDGIPSAILRRIIPRVASESSYILSQLSDGRYDAITIEEQDDGKLNIWVNDGSQKYGVHRFSGGEKVRIALAVRLAVSKVLSELPEAGKRLSKMRTLVIDEGDLGSLDGEGVNSTIAIIQDLTKLFGLTVLISHLEAVRGWVGGNYVVIHRGDHEKGSTVEYA
jgi:exonuclease SbcC